MYQLQYHCPYCGDVYLLRSRYERHFRTHPYQPSAPGEYEGADPEDAERYDVHAGRAWPFQNGTGHLGGPPGLSELTAPLDFSALAAPYLAAAQWAGFVPPTPPRPVVAILERDELELVCVALSLLGLHASQDDQRAAAWALQGHLSRHLYPDQDR